MTRGIISAGGYVPYRRLQRSEIAKTFGSGGGRGTRSVASYDEDTTTMGVEAARLALKSAPAGITPDFLWFSTAEPAYLDKNNASTIHAALPSACTVFIGSPLARSRANRAYQSMRRVSIITVASAANSITEPITSAFCSICSSTYSRP